MGFVTTISRQSSDRNADGRLILFTVIDPGPSNGFNHSKSISKSSEVHNHPGETRLCQAPTSCPRHVSRTLHSLLLCLLINVCDSYQAFMRSYHPCQGTPGRLFICGMFSPEEIHRSPCRNEAIRESLFGTRVPSSHPLRRCGCTREQARSTDAFPGCLAWRPMCVWFLAFSLCTRVTNLPQAEG